MKLGPRLNDLEKRVGNLERRVGHLEGQAKRASPPPAASAREEASPRCPGCRLPMEERGGRCVWCGFVMDAASPGRA